MAYESRQFMILATSEISSIQFGDILESHTSTLRRSVDGSKTFIKWDGAMPSWVNDLTTTQYRHSPLPFEKYNTHNFMRDKILIYEFI